MARQDVVEATRAAYDQVAQVYRAVNSDDMPGTLAKLARVLVASLSPRARPIDVGCGVGRDMAWFESQGFRVTGVDLSAMMLAQARELASGDLLRMNMQRLGLADASFDGAWCAASLLHLPKPVARPALREVQRILRPGAGLMVSVQEGDGEAWAGGYVDGVQRFFSYYTAAEMEAMLSEAGFAVQTLIVDPAPHNWLSFLAHVA